MGLLWGAAILCVGIIHMANPNYGVSFLQMMSSVYPGFHSSGTVGGLAIGTIEGIIDGAIAGLVLSLLHNAFTYAHTEA